MQEAHAREERIDLLRRQIARRMLHRDVRASGGTSGTAPQQHAAHNLHGSPAQQVRAGWNSWHSLWRAKVGERQDEQASQLTQLREELSSLRDALEAQKAAAANEKRVALERLRA